MCLAHAGGVFLCQVSKFLSIVRYVCYVLVQLLIACNIPCIFRSILSSRPNKVKDSEPVEASEL